MSYELEVRSYKAKILPTPCHLFAIPHSLLPTPP